MRSFLAIVILVLGAGVLIWFFTRQQPVHVNLYTVGKGRVESTVSNTRVGTVKACRRAKIAPAVGGQVAVLNVKEGSRVRVGEILLEIWNDDLKAEHRLAESQSLTSLAEQKEVCLRAEGAEREANRLLGLVKKKLISEERVDVATTDAHAQRAACDAARSRVKVALARTTVVKATVDKTILRAPFSGVVAEVNAELGEFVTPSPPGIQTLPAIDLVDAACLYVSAPIDEVDAPAIAPQMPACVTLDAFRDRRCSGIVRRVAPYVLDTEKQARTVEVEVELADAEEQKGLLPGYSADIEIILQVRDETLRIPSEAILDGDKILLFHGRDAALEERPIGVGLANWEWTEIASGLDAGDKIVTNIGDKGVEPGARVTDGPPRTP